MGLSKLHLCQIDIKLIEAYSVFSSEPKTLPVTAG